MSAVNPLVVGIYSFSLRQSICHFLPSFIKRFTFLHDNFLLFLKSTYYFLMCICIYNSKFKAFYLKKILDLNFSFNGKSKNKSNNENVLLFCLFCINDVSLNNRNWGYGISKRKLIQTKPNPKFDRMFLIWIWSLIGPGRYNHIAPNIPCFFCLF